MDNSTFAGGSAVSRALRHGWPVILLVALAAVAASVYTLSRQEPEYQATARLLVSPIRQDDTALFGTDLIRDAGDASQTAATAAAVIESHPNAEETAKRLGSEWTAEAVLEAVTVEAVERTSVINVTATASDPEVAAGVASEFAESVVRLRRKTIVEQLDGRYEVLAARRREAPVDDYSQRDRLFSEMRLIRNTLNSGGDPTLRLVETAVAPSKATGRSPAMVVALALMGGLGLGLAAAFGIELMRRRPVRPENELVAA